MLSIIYLYVHLEDEHNVNILGKVVNYTTMCEHRLKYKLNQLQ